MTGYYFHPISGELSMIDLEDKYVYKVEANGFFRTTYGFYLSPGPGIAPLSNPIYPIFDSEENLRKILAAPSSFGIDDKR